MSIFTTRCTMSIDALFGLSILMRFLAFAIVTKVCICPRLRVMSRTDALLPVVLPHTFRFAGLSVLVPWVVSPSLSSAFAIPAAYGDLVAAILAGVATLALAARASWAIPIVWGFNVWGAVDLLHAFYQGQIGVGIAPGSLGAAFFIPTVIVPPLLILDFVHSEIGAAPISEWTKSSYAAADRQEIKYSHSCFGKLTKSAFRADFA